ncbi:MAG: PAS domain-containing protein [Dehalococcoidia bacterium]|nr:PAS domain-containing protein [Dehalococcoidia bacterium]
MTESKIKLTEQKGAESEITCKIIDGSPIPTFTINEQHKIVHWNIALESLSGAKREKVVGTDRQWVAFYTEKRPTLADLIVDKTSIAEIEQYYQDKGKKSSLIDGAYEAEDFFPQLGENGRWLHFMASPVKNNDGEIIGAIETLQDVTERRHMENRSRLYVQQITKAQEEERARIARELHDELAQSLLLLTQGLDFLTSTEEEKLSGEPLIQSLEKLHSQAIGALEDLRRCVQDLRPPILDQLGLLATLEWMAEDLTQKYGLDIQVKMIGSERGLPTEIELLLFRIAQEALTNTRRHAEASHAWITLEFGDDEIVLAVNDNGKGFKLPEQGDFTSMGKLGLAGMKQRALLANGTIEMKSTPGRGTSLIVRVPRDTP